MWKPWCCWASLFTRASKKIELFQKAVELGEIQNAELMETQSGHFWSITETRSLMRAKHGLATALATDGQANEAIAQMLDILRLNADDNLGVRYQIIPLLLSQNRDQAATEILASYSEETANWLYLKAQVAFRSKGPKHRTAQSAILAAIRFNPHVIELLMGPEPPAVPEHYALRSPEEAAVVIEEQFDSWTETEGFIDWMFARHAAWQRDTSKRQRDKK